MDQETLDKLKDLSLSDKKKSNPFENKDIISVAKLLKEGYFKNIMLMVGAGVSVNAGIPDFRSKGGFYDILKQQGLPRPEIVFDLKHFRENPSLFYEFAGLLDTSTLKPTLTHYFFKLLEEKNLLNTCFTQNIDGLELSAGLSSSKLVQAHGHMESVRCVRCGLEGSLDKFKMHMKEKTVYYCENCPT